MNDVNESSSFVHRVPQNLLGDERKSDSSKKDLQGEGSPSETKKGIQPSPRYSASFSLSVLCSCRYCAKRHYQSLSKSSSQ